jgi:hypothetical protein
VCFLMIAIVRLRYGRSKWLRIRPVSAALAGFSFVSKLADQILVLDRLSCPRRAFFFAHGLPKAGLSIGTKPGSRVRQESAMLP